MPCHVYDPGSRQRHAYEAAIQVIQRHLVGDARLREAQGTNATEIGLAHRGEIHASSGFDQLLSWQRAAAGAGLGSRRQHLSEVIQLSGGKYVRMAAEDSFDQRGTAARKADDEDG